jgi:hypothetical protein
MPHIPAVDGAQIFYEDRPVSDHPLAFPGSHA